LENYAHENGDRQLTLHRTEVINSMKKIVEEK
jgi:hypothetical protein